MSYTRVQQHNASTQVQGHEVIKAKGYEGAMPQGQVQEHKMCKVMMVERQEGTIVLWSEGMRAQDCMGIWMSGH